MVPFYLRSLLSCVVHIIGVFYLKFKIFFWNLSVVVYTYPCSQRCPWISKVTKPASLSRAHGGQAICLARGQAGHSNPSFTDHFRQDQKASRLMEITCLMQTGTLSAVAGLWGSLASLWQSRSPVGTTEEGPSTSPALREPHTDPTYFLTTPGASRSVWLGVHTWCSNHLVETHRLAR